MDTKFWGPSGWRLLHLIAQAGRGPLPAFFESLPYVLPCKFCRKSLSEYIEEDPIPSKKGDFPKWLWRIHNAVNAKLRRQGILKSPAAEDPPFKKVEEIYKGRLELGCTRTTFEGWNFLFSVAESHPFSRQARGSLPIQGHPPISALVKAPALELNRWNLLSPEERLPYYNRFWTLLPQVLPFPEWTKAWERASDGTTNTKCRTDCLKGVWTIRRTMEEDLELLNRTTYSNLCKDLRTFRSGCSSSTRGKTCRRNRRAI